MREPFNILFCDNEDRKHQDFREAIIGKLNLSTEDKKSLQFFHSQSLSPSFERHYSEICKKYGAKSVGTWIHNLIKFDLVITDLDFKSVIQMGSPDTGFDIMEKIQARGSRRWTKYILLTAHADQASQKRYLEIGSKHLLDKKDFIQFSLVNTEYSWDQLRVRTERLITSINKKRQKYFSDISAYEPQDLYDISIIFQKEPEDQANSLIVEIKEKGKDGAFLKFVLGKEGYTLRALVEARRYNEPFIRNGDLAQLATTLSEKFRDKRLDKVEQINEHSIRNHVREIRNIIRQSVTKLNYTHEEIETAGKSHRTHKKGIFCADCIIQTGSREPFKGYRLATSVVREYGVDRYEFEDLYSDAI